MGARNRSAIATVARLRQRAALAIWTESIARAAAPACGLMLAYLVLGLFGYGNPWLLAATASLALLALGIGLWHLQRPEGGNIDRRIETASGLQHRPLDALDDAPETDSEFAVLLWQAHQARMAAALSRARTGALALQSASRDPLALRGLLFLLLLTAVTVAGQAAPARLGASFTLPAWPFAGPSVNAWITPPSYAGQPPQVLRPGQAITALTGSGLTVITSGLWHTPLVRLGATAFSTQALGRNSHRADAVLAASGRLTIGPWWHRAAAWTIQVVPPEAPHIRLDGIETANANQLTLTFNIADKYGVAALTVRFYAAGHPQALPLDFTLPANRGANRVKIDLSASPFYGLPVGFSLNATNIAGVTAHYDPHDRLILPGLDLHDKTAMALNQLRQNIALAPATAPLIGAVLQQVSTAPPSAVTAAVDVQMAVLASALADGGIGAPAAAARLLALIRQVEAGPGFAAQQALAAANQALAAALERGLHGRQPDQTGLQKLLQAIHGAMAQFLAEAMPATATTPAGPAMDMSALDQLAQKIAADEAAGRTQQAAAELHQLKQMLAVLQTARPMTAAEAAKAQAASQGAQAISHLMQSEGNLLDQTHSGTALPAGQAALQAQLQSVARALAKAGISVPGLGKAQTAMGSAETALGQPDLPQAEEGETAAIQNLQQAAAALAAARRNRLSIGQGGQQVPGGYAPDEGVNGAPDEQFDPNLNFSTGNAARAIQQRIIKQDSNPALAPPAHQYYHRLLDQDQEGP